MKKKLKENNIFPWQKPKSKQEDPNAPKQLKEIMNSPNYQLLEDNIFFLGSKEARAIRLQLDYTRVEVKLKEEHIEHTIVVFGGSRIIEYDSALKKLKEIEKLLLKSPRDQALLTDLGIAERMVKKSIYYDEARKFGRLVGGNTQEGEGSHLTIMTGGGPGIMEAANRGAFDVGAKSIGLNIELPHEQYPNPYITPDLCFQFKYFAIRKFHFMQRARAFVVFPGGYGTLDELFEILTLIQTQKNSSIPVLFVSKSYWNKVIDFEFLFDEGLITKKDIELFYFVENAQEAWDSIKTWYEETALSELF